MIKQLVRTTPQPPLWLKLAFHRAFRQPFVPAEAIACPCCQSRVAAFRPFGKPVRPGVLCPVCGALERHRAVTLFLREHFKDGKRPSDILHFAPEDALEGFMRKLAAKRYVSADLVSPRAMRREDITALTFGANEFDFVLCSHVLEHIADDAKAMAELFRVLRPGGEAVILVPLRGDVTFEDPTVTTDEGRERAFGQRDHVRWFGRDIRARLEKTGFEVSEHVPAETVPSPERERLGLSLADIVYLCRKPI
ncbi:class I SAM-dependent methyltransferase [Candidatus Poribacteria bacterium]|nr:class I SAM-dependent methyltransferase [Candidatus Poribacteria bacterium]